MKVLLPTDTTHTIKLIPRFTPVGALLMKFNNDIEDQVPTYNLANGIISLTFNLVGVEQDRFSFDLLNDNEIIYRGRLFFTNQITQDFKLTENTYTYV